jgi:S1-C subfamily serine protease
MRSFVSCVLAVLILAFCVSLHVRADEPNYGAVRIGSTAGHGTAFFVGNQGLVVTAGHVVKGAGKSQLYIWVGRVQVSVEVVYLSDLQDIAVLRAPITPRGYEVSCDYPEPGLPVYSIGFPADFGKAVVYGRIAGYEPLGHERRTLVDITATFGQSGAPILDEQDRVRGVLVNVYGTSIGQTHYVLAESGYILCEALALSAR